MFELPAVVKPDPDRVKKEACHPLTKDLFEAREVIEDREEMNGLSVFFLQTLSSFRVRQDLK